MKPRCYQLEIVETTITYLFEEDGNPVIASPTGTGKTVAFNYLLKRLLEEAPDMKALVVTHDQRIISQNASCMRKVCPTASIGIYSSGIGIRETHKRVTFCGIQSIYKRPQEFGHVDILIIDEAHLVSDKENTMYQKLVNKLKEINPNIRIIGFSGTPYRMKTGLITEGNIFTKVIIDFTRTEKFNWFVTEGYLVRLVTKPTGANIDVTNVKMRGGDFDEHELQAVTDTDELNFAIAQECVKHGKDRNHWLGFAVGVKHGERLAEVFQKLGVSCAIFHSKMPEGDEKGTEPGTQNYVLKQFHSGKVRCLINVGMLTTGYDFPALDMLFIARATQSPGLWVQILGRGTRPNYLKGMPLDTAEQRLAAIAASDKPNCLVLDFARNTERLGPINDPVVPHPRKKGAPMEGKAPVKICGSCGAYNHARAAFCVHCGDEFPPPATIEGQAGTKEVMTALPQQDNIRDFDVSHLIYEEHKTRQGNNSIQISYMCGPLLFKKYLVFDGAPENQTRVVNWWKHHGGKMPAPKSPGGFLYRQDELKRPVICRVITNRKYPDVIGVFFSKEEAANEDT